MQKQKFLVIDGTALVFRGFYAIPSLTSRDGNPTNAIYGFYTILLNLLLAEKPDYFAVCFDRPEETDRKKEYPEYKATRVRAPDELLMQINPIKEILQNVQLNLVERPGIEADDLIATLVDKNSSANLDSLVYSSDLDLLQLVNPHVRILKPGSAKQGNKLVDEAYIREHYGLTPLQIVDFKGLCGDSSDNLPGVKGVGKKTAVKLLNEYGSLEEVYNNLEKIPGSLKLKLAQDKEQAFLCKKLASLNYNCKIDANLNIYDFFNVNSVNLKEALQALSIFKLNDKVDKFQKLRDLKLNQLNQMSMF